MFLLNYILLEGLVQECWLLKTNKQNAHAPVLIPEYFLLCRHAPEMSIRDSIWISLLFEWRAPCIIYPAVYRGGCTYGMEAQPGFEIACAIQAQWGIKLNLWKFSMGLGDALAFCVQKRLLSTEAGKQPGEALIATCSVILK